MVARVYAPTRIGDEGDGEVIDIRAVRRFGDQNPNAALEGPTARILVELDDAYMVLGRRLVLSDMISAS